MVLFKSSKRKDQGQGDSNPASNGTTDGGAPPAYVPVADGRVPATETIPADTKPQPQPDYQAPPPGPPPNAAPEIDLPEIDLTAAFSNLRVSNASLNPDPDTCLAHLKLLAAFEELREDIGYTDGLWSIWDTRADPTGDAQPTNDQNDLSRMPLPQDGPQHQHTPEDMRKAVLSVVREKRWSLFVARAVDRYTAWWTAMFRPVLTEGHLLQPGSPAFETFPLCRDPLQWTEAMLPPLDVLMVWHAHMLNPRLFLEDCMRHGARHFWAGGMPWEQVNTAIDTKFQYDVSDGAKAAWVALTGRAWSNVDDAMVKKMKCPGCLASVEIPWTTCGMEENPKSPARPGLVGNGYGDSGLNYSCTSCGLVITKELLSAAKFVEDSKALLLHGILMPGTFMDPKEGKPIPMPKLGPQYSNHTLPNRMIQHCLRSQLTDLIHPGVNPAPTMDTIRKMIEAVIADKKLLKRCSHTSTLHPAARVCIRKMMSRYWDNHSPFALDLVGAVLRQGIFAGKMGRIDWLHSPSASATMARLIDKYGKFFTIMAALPHRVAVPTLDVDLAWHTHQLSPGAYWAHSIELTAKFIDHDDKIDEDRLGMAFEWTSKVYQERFGQVYSECTCWYCESVRGSLSSGLGRLLGVSTQETVSENFHTSGAASLCPPDKSAHISAHNAVRGEYLSGTEGDRARKKIATRARAAFEARLEENYVKACRRAEKKGRKLPPKNEYHDHWGSTYYMYSPAHHPLYWTPLIAGGAVVFYGAGGWASCAAGSCGASGVGSGGCSNIGASTACSSGCGGNGGGCGGGGGGCGGGGGGGGCGGGGGGGS